jgi:hypothetical protein
MAYRKRAVTRKPVRRPVRRRRRLWVLLCLLLLSNLPLTLR